MSKDTMPRTFGFTTMTRFALAACLLVFTPALADGDVPSDTAPANAADTSARPGQPAANAQVNLHRVFERLGPDAAQWYQHVQTLANPFFEGRVTGSKGIERAREYLEFYLKKYGLGPAFADPQSQAGGERKWSSYRQPFTFQTRGRVDIRVQQAQASINGRSLTENQDFTLLGNSASEAVQGPVTFVGYGIEEGPRGYTSFDQQSDLTGRIALLLRYEPLNKKGESQWASEHFSEHAAVSRKMRALVERGAAGIILVNPPNVRDGESGLIPLRYSARFSRPLDIPAMQVTADVAERMLSHAARDVDVDVDSLLAWRRLADQGAITTVDLPDDLLVRFGGTINRERQRDTLPAENIGAVLRGQGDLADQWLVIGGHYDHNGYGNMMFSADPDAGPLYPGADDNASGVAGMIILAKRLSRMYAEAEPDKPLRSVLFIAFDAEERGLHGSRYFADHPTIEPSKMTALLNMDMIGRLRNEHLSIFGAGTGEDLESIVQRHVDASGLSATITKAGTGRSDDANFHRIKVPAMHFFTGMHPQYTTPEDKAWTVNPAGAIRVINLVADIAIELVTRPQRLAFAEPPDSTGRDRGYAPVRLGIQPGMGGEHDTGVLIDDVSAGTSADNAGLQGGDIMLTWNDTELESLRTLVELLRQHEPGDVVTVTFLRDGKKQKVDVTLRASEDSDG